MSFDFRDERGNWVGSSNDNGYCSDTYGCYTGRVYSDGYMSDRYGNHIGSIDLDTGRIYDKNGYDTGSYATRY